MAEHCQHVWKYLHRLIYSGVLQSAQFYLFMWLFWRTPSTLKIAKSSPPYIFIQLMYYKNDHLAKQSIFVRCLMSSLASTTTPTLDPRRPLHMFYIIITTCHCPKGYLGSRGGGEHLNIKDTTFTFPVTNVTILSIFRTHAQEGYCKVFEMKSTSIIYSLALLLFEN